MKQENSSIRRNYNRLVADETIEDYSLRYTPKSFRNFSESIIANTSIGSISFLALEAIGATIGIEYGFTTAFWAILGASLIIFLTAIPISYHAAKYNIDIDLITRSAGFGYIGSTFTSLIYASFSFIFFALEASIMAQALFLYFGLPLSWGYLLSAIIIIPMVYRGITFINKLHLYTQPVWIFMMLAPFVAILYKDPTAITTFLSLRGQTSQSSEFNFYYFGFALGISLSLIAQIGEQVDYLRFMPELTQKNRLKWWSAVLIAGPGWIVLGFLKQMGGIFLASLVLASGLSIYEAKTPIEMYYLGYQYIFDNPETALAVATLFVVVSQIKINVTNAYAGSLAWSNFFSRLTHAHPGRVVWMVFNIGIALVLMEMGVFDFLEKILGLYSNVAIAWISAVTADLMINKPFGLSPKIVEFKRAYLYNVNPVGVGSMGIASVVSILAFMGFFGAYAQSYSSVIAMLLAFVLSPLIAYITKGKYYIARKNLLSQENIQQYRCEVCDIVYEQEDMAYCPFHDVKICSLCCSLDSLCHDSCKKKSEQMGNRFLAKKIQKLFLHKISLHAAKRIFDFTLFSTIVLFIVGTAFWMIYSLGSTGLSAKDAENIKSLLTMAFFVIAILIMILIWFYLLSYENRLLAEDELEEQNKILKKQKRKEAQQSQMIEQTHDSVVSTNLDGYILSWNHGSELLYGYTEKEMLGKHVSMLASKEDRYIALKNIEILKQTGSFEGESVWVRKDGKQIYIDISLSLLKDDKGNNVGMVGYMRDITQKTKIEKELEKQRAILKQQAHYDTLTGLANRLLFKDTLIQTLEYAKRHSKQIALFFIDLDRFKQINDSLGHHIGDKVLQEAAARLQKSVRKEDTVARLGGDEFTVIMQSLTKAEDASLLAQKILKLLAQPMELEGHTLYITSSIGISLFPDDSTTVEKLLTYADSAMYMAKEGGKNDFAYYSQNMTLSATNYIELESGIRKALENKEFVVYYQPQIDARTETLIGMEGLVRWQHPQKGLISPTDFLPVAQESGLIVMIDRYVMKSAFEQFAKWYKDGYKPGILALNLTIKQLFQEDFIEFLEKLIMQTGVKTQWLELEISEGEVMKNPQEAIVILKKISNMGIKLAIDDFGTGYSSLANLKLLPIEKLKIDKSFVDGVPDNEDDAAIARAVIALGKTLHLEVIAEGVEHESQKDFLLENGCNDIQGYLYSKPIPAEDVKKFF
ncbi:MAG: EAL domain-containing protein [Sulfurospirillum sp.]